MGCCFAKLVCQSPQNVFLFTTVLGWTNERKKFWLLRRKDLLHRRGRVKRRSSSCDLFWSKLNAKIFKTFWAFSALNNYFSFWPWWWSIQVFCVLAIDSNDLSSNPAEVCSFHSANCLKRVKINKKMPEIAHLKKLINFPSPHLEDFELGTQGTQTRRDRVTCRINFLIFCGITWYGVGVNQL